MARSRMMAWSALVAIWIAGQAGAALLVHYKFDEGSGSTTANLGTAGSAGDLSLVSGAGFSSFGQTPDGGGYSLVNTGTWAGSGGGAQTVSSLDALDNLTAMTITGWYRVDSGLTGLARLVDRASNSPTSGEWTLYVDGDPDKLQFNLAGTTFVSGGGYNQANKWVFFALTFQGGGAVSFYIGDTTTPVAANGSSSTSITSLGDGTRKLTVGNRETLTRAFVGSFDDVRIYDEVLSLSQLEDVRVQGIPEPGTAGLMMLSLLGVTAARRMRSQVG